MLDKRSRSLIMAQPIISVLANLQRVERPPSGRRRTETRYQCGPATPGRLLLDPTAVPQRVWVLNLSTRGAGLLVDQPLEATTEFVICLKSSTTDRTFQLTPELPTVPNRCPATGCSVVNCSRR